MSTLRFSNDRPRIRALSVVGIAAMLILATLAYAATTQDSSPGISSSVEQRNMDSAAANSEEARVGALGAGHPAIPRRALSWLNGLGTGQILPTDVTSRLHRQHPRLASVVMSAWRALNPSD